MILKTYIKKIGRYNDFKEYKYYLIHYFFNQLNH